jgi:hypothetical protein
VTNESNGPPVVDVDGLDFSQFHDLMHRPFGPYCWTMYGGPRRHVALWWKYQASPDIRRATLCRVDRHEWADCWRRSKGWFKACTHCARPYEEKRTMDLQAIIAVYLVPGLTLMLAVVIRVATRRETSAQAVYGFVEKKGWQGVGREVLVQWYSIVAWPHAAYRLARHHRKTT